MPPHELFICDDDTDMAEELGEYFLYRGWSVHVFNDAQAVLDALASGLRPACLLTDICMPKLNGIDLMRKIRAMPDSLQPRLMFAMTGQPRLGFPHALAEVKDCYSKPLDPQGLEADLLARL